MRVFLYEHLTACRDAALPASLVVEGAAMLAAVAADLGACADVEVVIGGDVQFEEAVTSSDGTLLIAPETDGLLTGLAATVERFGGRLLSPPSSFCAWASDKSQVAETMQSAGVPMPRGVLLAAGDSIPDDFPFPAILKPNDGCGSQGITLLPSGEGGRKPDEGTLPMVDVDPQREGLKRREFPSPDRCRDRPLPAGEADSLRLEEYVAGLATSVALLRGSAGVFALPACVQRLTDDGAFAYLGGSCPLEPSLAARAERLALLAVAAMPEWHGYIGLDLVLGPADDGLQDYLIEVNPRLTTSYVGLRTLSETNLAAAMLDVVAGRVPKLSFRTARIEFDAAGNVRYAATL